MKPLVFFEVDGHTSCDVVGAPTYEDFLSLSRYFIKYWQADVEELFDTGFAAKFKVIVAGRYFIMMHDSQVGNYLSSPNKNINDVIPDILLDLDNRLGED